MSSDGGLCSLDSGSVTARNVIVSSFLAEASATCPKENNDYRPVALTSIVMKCLERIVACKLRLDVQDYLDPFQFAYRQGRGTDTLSTLLSI